MTEPRCISDAAKHGVPITVEYASVSPFSGERILLVHNDHFAMYNDQGFMRDLFLRADSEPRWSRADRTDTDVIYYIGGKSLWCYNVRSGSNEIVRQFTEYEAISGLGEGDLQDTRFALCGDGHSVFIYDVATDRKSPAQPKNGWQVLDSLYMTPDGNLLIAWKDEGSGIHLYNQKGKHVREVANRNGHHDVGRDSAGDEVMIWCSSNDAQINKNAVVKVRLADGQQTVLLELDWSLAFHVSCCDAGAVVSTYGAAVKPDAPHADEILWLSHDGAVEPLCKHGSIISRYTDQPKASASRDGKRIVFCRGESGTTNVWQVDRGATSPVDPPESNEYWAAAVRKGFTQPQAEFLRERFVEKV